MTPEEKSEPLPPEMYSREVSLRIMRHAVWHLNYGDIRSKYRHKNEGDIEACLIIAAMQGDVICMSLADFYRIKILGCITVFYNA